MCHVGGLMVCIRFPSQLPILCVSCYHYHHWVRCRSHASHLRSVLSQLAAFQRKERELDRIGRGLPKLNARVHKTRTAHSNRGTALTAVGGDRRARFSHGGNERRRCAVMNAFFFIITAFSAAVPLQRRISDMKHVASWVLGLFRTA